ncbi:hypothetical protein TNCV_4807861 [Trichonephila clavipes]|nr:hypothetical protein TNCV_4807861 [Trichonephila clavipes]
MRARVYHVYPSTCDHWVLRCMSKCPHQVVSLKRDPQCLSPQASLVLIYRPTAIAHFMVDINLELVLLDPKSPGAIEFWVFHPRSATPLTF